MNLPNKITLFRVLLIPFFLFAYLYDPAHGFAGGIVPLTIFILASVSDALDGYIARKRNLITNFGKLMDPLADKLLVCAALVAMTARGVLPAWVTVVIVSREFIITGLRQLALEQNLVIAASFWAKIKTISQIVMTIFLLVNIPVLLNFSILVNNAEILKQALIFVTTALTVVSAAEYLYKNRHVYFSKG